MSASIEQPDLRDSNLAGLCAGLLIACQVAGKAIRDALFLSSHSITDLPTMIMAAAIVSFVVVLASMRLLARYGPVWFMSRAFIASAVTLALIAGFSDLAPRSAAVAFYLYFAGFGAVLISGFWSVINERFDPRTARKRIGRIALGGTIGGLVGGLVAERLAMLGLMQFLIPGLALLQLLCAVIVRRVGHSIAASGPERTETGSLNVALSTLGSVSYLRSLAALVFTGTVAAVCLDYLFKARAVESMGSGEELLRFFALFYTGVGLVAFLLQAGVARRLLERSGLANSVAALPFGVAVSAAANLVVPGLATASVARGVEGSVRNSLFRSGYEPLFIPLPVAQKRTSKQFIDVGCERLGDIAGGGLVSLVLVVSTANAYSVLAVVALALGALGIWITRRVHAGWLRTLEDSLESRATELDLEDHDSATKTMVLRTIESLDLRRPTESESSARNPVASPEADPATVGILTLRTRQIEPVRKLLVRTPMLPREWVSHVIPLLAWDGVTDVAEAALRSSASRNAGQLLDHLLDPDEDFAIRRRLPPILAESPTQRTVDGLTAGLDDQRFEVRYQCGRALLRLVANNEALQVDRQRLFDAIRAEVQVERGVWEGHRLIDQLDDEFETPFDKEILRRRSNLGLEHVFTILAIAMPAKPVSIAYQGLFTDDRSLRGTSLEYLESILPDDIRTGLWPYLDASGSTVRDDADRDAILQKLMQSRASIQINLSLRDED